jgi:hypothetical protein
VKSYILFLWRCIDPFYFQCSRLTYLDSANNEKNVFRVRLTRYKGKSVTLADGSRIVKNDLLVKIHLHNIRILKEVQNMKSELKKTRFIYKKVEKSLPALAKYMKNHNKSDDIKGVIGITSLNRGTRRLGFEETAISNTLYKRFKQLSLLPISFLSYDNLSLKMLHKNTPCYLFMSKDRLLEKYTKKM